MKTAIWMTLGLCVATFGCATTSHPKSDLVAGSGCESLGDTRQAVGSFYEPGHIYSAKEVREKQFIARAVQPVRTVGAELYMHAQPGMTQEYLQRTLSCHAASGQPAHANDPLHPQSGSVKDLAVRSVGGSFAVKVIGDSNASGEEIWQRAKTFTRPSGSVTIKQLAKAGTSSHL